MNTHNELEISLYPRGDDTYEANLTLFRRQGDWDVLTPNRPRVRLDPSELVVFAHNPAQYGKHLGQLLFAEPELKAGLARALQSAQGDEGFGAPLRIRLAIDEKAVALHDLLWETLCNPEPSHGTLQPEHLLIGRHGVCLTRFLSSHNPRAPRPPPTSELRALVVIAGPAELSRYPVVPIKPAEEIAAIRKALDLPGVQIVSLGEGRATLSNILAELAQGIDLLYLLAHGTLARIDGSMVPQLLLEGEDGKAVWVDSRQLILAVEGLDAPPRLALLASCASAGGGRGYGGSLAALGPALARAGVPAVVAMQGLISVETSSMFMEHCFRKLRAGSGVDEAIAASRQAVAAVGHHDWWAPTLFSRLTRWQLWPREGEQVLEKLLQIWLMRDRMNLGPWFDRLLASVNACPHATRISLETVEGFVELVEQLRDLDAGTPGLAALDAVLEESLPQAIPWQALAELQGFLANIRLYQAALVDLHGYCKPPGWELPATSDDGKLLKRIVRQLGRTEVQAGSRGRSHPLVTFVRELLERFSSDHAVAAVEPQLRAWAEMIEERHNLSWPASAVAPGLVLDEGLPSILIQLSFLPNRRPDLANLDAEPLILDAWAIPSDKPTLCTQVKCTRGTVPGLISKIVAQGRSKLGGDKMPSLEFFLPLELLLEQVEAWEVRFGRINKPAGKLYQISVRSLDRITDEEGYPPELWRQKWERWRALKPAQVSDSVKWLCSVEDCNLDKLSDQLITGNLSGLLQLVTRDDLGEQDAELLIDLLSVALAAGIPAAVIVRKRPGEVAEAREAIKQVLAKYNGSQLPLVVQDLRNEANSVNDGNHLGNHLTLLWDDPHRLPPTKGLYYTEPRG